MEATGRAPAPDAPGFESLQQAARWFALLCSEDATEIDRSQWRAWLAERGENRDAWKYVEDVSRQFEPLQSGPEKHAAEKALKAASRRSASRRRVLGAIAVVSVTGLAGWGTMRATPLRQLLLAWRADYRTGTGEIREVTLPDGTRIWLNTTSALNVDYQTGVRRVHLIAGEVLIETAQDSRAFEVETAQGSLHPLGTRFVVRQFDDFSYLAVFEGRVEVRPAEAARVQVIEAGQQVTFTRQTISAPTAADRARQAWARGLLVADNIPLHQLVMELSRYRPGYLGCAPEVADLRVMGTYLLNNPDAILTLLEKALPVRVRRTTSWWLTVEAKN
jgi:transmembrane sensor